VFEINGQSLVTPEEATARYDALRAWFETYNMLVIGQGPYMLTTYDPPAQFAELTAFRDDAYPFTAADFRYGEPPTITIDPITPPDVVLGDPIEVPVTVQGPGNLSLQYAFVDPAAGEVLASGPAEGSGGSFTVTIDESIAGGLFPGLYQLFLLASSDEIAEVAESRVDLQVGV
jgi:peptide/nickel transport system substrate-binding protein